MDEPGTRRRWPSRNHVLVLFYFIFFSNVHTPFFGWWLPTSFWQCYNNLGAPHSRRQGKIERPTFTISRRPLGQPIFIFFSVSLFLVSCFSSRHTHKDVELGFKHTKNCIYIYTLPYSCVYRYIHRSSRNQWTWLFRAFFSLHSRLAFHLGHSFVTVPATVTYKSWPFIYSSTVLSAHVYNLPRINKNSHFLCVSLFWLTFQ